MTAAPLREGMYQPWRSSPSSVWRVMSSYGTPSWAVGTSARVMWVTP